MPRSTERVRKDGLQNTIKKKMIVNCLHLETHWPLFWGNFRKALNFPHQQTKQSATVCCFCFFEKHGLCSLFTVTLWKALLSFCCVPSKSYMSIDVSGRTVTTMGPEYWNCTARKVQNEVQFWASNLKMKRWLHGGNPSRATRGACFIW